LRDCNDRFPLGRAIFVEPCNDEPRKVFLGRIAHFREEPPAADWLGAWGLRAK
jgi:hypothetical protein